MEGGRHSDHSQNDDRHKESVLKAAKAHARQLVDLQGNPTKVKS